MKKNNRKGMKQNMKKLTLLAVVLFVVAAASFAFGAVSDTKHNLAAGIDITTTDEKATLCGFCHIPHGGVELTDAAGNVTVPLWARSNVRATYTLYNTGGGTTIGGNSYSSTLAQNPVFQPGPNSLTCLSCHDGQIGMNVTYKNGIRRDYTGMSSLAGNLGLNLELIGTNFPFDELSLDPGYNPLIGTNLQNDHPVGINFEDNAVVPGLGTGVAAEAAGARLYNYAGRSQSVECGSCHDPHVSDTAYPKFTRVLPVNLCQACHATK